jgi:ABC-type branched-subunit amino acid transport system ATPase component
MDNLNINLTPAQIARRKITNLFEQARIIANSDSEENVSESMMIRSKACIMLSKWHKNYPKEAAQEKKQEMTDKATRLRERAANALVFDMDGSIGAVEQKKRHDDYIKQAEAIEDAVIKLMGDI